MNQETINAYITALDDVQGEEKEVLVKKHLTEETNEESIVVRYLTPKVRRQLRYGLDVGKGTKNYLFQDKYGLGFVRGSSGEKFMRYSGDLL